MVSNFTSINHGNEKIKYLFEGNVYREFSHFVALGLTSAGIINSITLNTVRKHTFGNTCLYNFTVIIYHPLYATQRARTNGLAISFP